MGKRGRPRGPLSRMAGHSPRSRRAGWGALLTTVSPREAQERDAWVRHEDMPGCPPLPQAPVATSAACSGGGRAGGSR